MIIINNDTVGELYTRVLLNLIKLSGAILRFIGKSDSTGGVYLFNAIAQCLYEGREGNHLG